MTSTANDAIESRLRRAIEFDRTAAQLRRWGLDDWSPAIGRAVDAAAAGRHRGDWGKHLDALEAWADALRTGSAEGTGGDAAGSMDPRSVRVPISFTAPVQTIVSALQRLGPWDKGPWQVGPVAIDAQWRSDLKWDRIAELVDWPGAVGIDVGGGNGYYAHRAIDRGAGVVVVVDPTPVSIVQGLAVVAANRCGRRSDGGISRPTPLYWPIEDAALPLACDDNRGPAGPFDFALTMGVLYHHRSPIDHLRRITASLRPGGIAVVETLYVEFNDQADDLRAAATAWTPPGRYAGMRNVWMIPTIDGLVTWLRRVGMTKIEVVDRTQTTSVEQRSTTWAPGHSLAEGLDPLDPRRTIEGHPAPRRVVIRCRRG